MGINEMKTKIIISLLCVFLVSANLIITAQNLNETNLILHYSFDGNVKDLSSKNNDLNIESKIKNNMYMWVKGKGGTPNTALEFTPNSEPLIPRINISPSKLPEFTFTAWVYGQPKGFLLGTIKPAGGDKNLTPRYLLFVNGCVQTGYMAHVDVAEIDLGRRIKSLELPDNQWNFIAITSSAKDSTLKLYVNDEYYEPDEIKKPAKVFHSNKGGSLLIGGAKNIFNDAKFVGIVDEIRIYNKALTDNEISAISGLQVKDAADSITIAKYKQMSLIIGILVFFAISIVLMIYILFKEKKYKLLTDTDFNTFVNNSKKLSDSDKDNNNTQASKIIEDAFSEWPLAYNDGKDDYFMPKKRRHIKHTYEALEKAKKMEPTEKHIIDRMNELGNICNDLNKRKFYGNKVLIGAALITPILYAIIQSKELTQTDINLIIALLLPTIAYILSNFAPTYLVAGRNGKLNRMFGGIFAALMGAGSTVAATQYYNKITWSNGSKTVEYDTSSNLISLIFGILIIIAAILLSIVLVGISAFISFLRNYVLYV